MDGDVTAANTLGVAYAFQALTTLVARGAAMEDCRLAVLALWCGVDLMKHTRADLPVSPGTPAYSEQCSAVPSGAALQSAWTWLSSSQGWAVA